MKINCSWLFSNGAKKKKKKTIDILPLPCANAERPLTPRALPQHGLRACLHLCDHIFEAIHASAPRVTCAGCMSYTLTPPLDIMVASLANALRGGGGRHMYYVHACMNVDDGGLSQFVAVGIQ